MHIYTQTSSYIGIGSRCANRLNFLGDAGTLAQSFHDTFELINLDRFVEHVKTCPDPTCGVVWCIDGTCKVFREICGAALPRPDGANSSYNADESDVQNAMNRGFLRQKVCDKMPPRSTRHCRECTQRLASRNEDRGGGHNDCTDRPPELNEASEATVRKSRRILSRLETADTGRSVVDEGTNCINSQNDMDEVADEESEEVRVHMFQCLHV